MLLDELTNIKKKILIIGAHPDDAEFSTGRLLLRRNGKNAFIVCMTDGRKGQEGTKADKILSEDDYALLRIDESRKALREFGISEEYISYYGLPDQGVLANPFIIDRIYMALKKHSPDYFLIPPWEGAHPDHDATHLFSVIAARNLSYSKEKIIEYGSYNNYNGEFRVQEFVPQKDMHEERLIPSSSEQKKWNAIMKLFASQKNQQEEYIPRSRFENFRMLPDYDYSKLPYTTKQSEIIRELFAPIYPFARNILPRDGKLFYETWKDNIDPSKVKEKLNEHIKNYKLKN
jgi:LmbE family N-acetylglucosaminyl deacetylase